MSTLDWIIVAGFFLCLALIATVTNRMSQSVAGFLSCERLAGRYLLTVSQSMAFIAAVAIIGNFESIYRNGLGGHWWGLMFVPVTMIIALSGFVVYRYRETRALTMAQFLQMRYSRRLRVFAGILGFFSGVLNCAVFPMVTANFLLYFFQLPETYTFLGVALPTYHSLMFFMVGFAVLMAVAGGQVTILVTDFFQGVIVTAGFLVAGAFIVIKLGWTRILDTLLASEHLANPAASELVGNFARPEGASMLNPFKMDSLPDFGVPFFIMMLLLQIFRTGVWQGGAGYMTAARTPHEARMGGILGNWRGLLVGLGTTGMALGAYVVVWNPEFSELRMHVSEAVQAVGDPSQRSQMFVPIVLGELFAPGVLGLFAILMLGAAISTDNSAYHSWGSIFLQDVILPFRKQPFSREEHLRWLRWSIVLIGVIAFVFSSIWTMKDFIMMWFQITGAIYIGGASCAIIGGLYWKRATTAGAWSGLITGSVLSVGGIIFKQVHPTATFPWDDQIINGLHLAVMAVVVSYIVFILVSLLTYRTPCNMDHLLHRGAYAVPSDLPEPAHPPKRLPWLLRKVGINHDFSKFDIFIYFMMGGYTLGFSLLFFLGTAHNLTHDVPSTTWRIWWIWILGVQAAIAAVAAVWFTCGGLRDLVRLFRDLKNAVPDEADDGTVQSVPNAERPD